MWESQKVSGSECTPAKAGNGTGVEREAQTKQGLAHAPHSRKDRAVDEGPASAFEGDWKTRRELVRTSLTK